MRYSYDTKVFSATSPEETLEALNQIQQELIQIQNALRFLETDGVLLKEHHSEPRNIDNMLVLADGTNWNPGGGGAGLYVFRSGTGWVKIG